MSKIYPKHVTGRFRSLKNVLSVSLQGLLFVTPWLTWNGRPILNINLAGGKLHLFGFTYWPQETHFMLILLMMSGLGMFLTSAVLGRIWCGFACPHTLFSHAFIYVERFFEGDAYERVRRDSKSWSEKLPTKIKTWTVWLLMSVYLGVTFAGYFTPIQEVVNGLVDGELSRFNWSLIAFFTTVSMVFFGIIRSRFCTTICPYARFQGALTTEKTRMVNYDTLRGEPRGKKHDPNAADCVDCNACVSVCPNGIDIRDGFQFSCINCASCIDACDHIMEKLDRPKGLVRFTSLDEIEEGAGHQWSARSWVRSLGARPWVYVVLLAFCAGLLGYLTITRPPFDFHAVRVATGGNVGQSYDGRIINRYEFRVVNRTPGEKRLTVELAEAPEGAEIATMENPFILQPEEVKTVELMVLCAPRGAATSVPLIFRVTDGTRSRSRESSFMIGINRE